MQTERVEVQLPVNPRGKAKITINGKDWTKSVRSIRINAAYDEPTTVELEFFAEVNMPPAEEP